MLQFIRAKKAVVSNASMWDTLKLLPADVIPKSYIDRVHSTPQCESFMHLHLGFDAEVNYSVDFIPCLLHSLFLFFDKAYVGDYLCDYR